MSAGACAKYTYRAETEQIACPLLYFYVKQRLVLIRKSERQKFVSSSGRSIAYLRIFSTKVVRWMFSIFAAPCDHPLAAFVAPGSSDRSRYQPGSFSNRFHQLANTSPQRPGPEVHPHLLREETPSAPQPNRGSGETFPEDPTISPQPVRIENCQPLNQIGQLTHVPRPEIPGKRSLGGSIEDAVNHVFPVRCDGQSLLSASGISSTRSRNGGISIGNTLRR